MKYKCTFCCTQCGHESLICSFVELEKDIKNQRSVYPAVGRTKWPPHRRNIAGSSLYQNCERNEIKPRSFPSK
jgi:hypothetical protein